jgi:bis(5'-nucleosyl)-tetraphosphatase (symmetrical)
LCLGGENPLAPPETKLRYNDSMATWVIGDVHGCWRTLEGLLGDIGWDAREDRVWLIGDLVNKGRGSLEVLRWAADPRNRVDAVLGNHDLHLLARQVGIAKSRREDTLDEILTAPDCDRLLTWLRRRPLLVELDGAVLVHAGILPDWSLDAVRTRAEACRRLLAGDGGLQAIYERRRTVWSDELDGQDAAAAALAVFTRLRLVGPDRRPRWGYTGPLDDAPSGQSPWWQGARIVSPTRPVLFGHWAQLGLFAGPGVRCLDGACVYGGRLAAFRLQDGRLETRSASAADLK